MASGVAFRSEVVVSAGCSIRCRTWGESTPGRSDLVLVHGGAAHARWWDHLAPTLAVNRRVLALDLSGHGESGWRSAYSFELWAGEVADAFRRLDLNRPVLVGHSLGGMVVLHAAALTRDQTASVIVLDSALQMLDKRSDTVRERAERDSPRFPSGETAVRRFRLIPEAEVEPDLLHYIASSSVRQIDGSWTWRFDRRTFARTDSGSKHLPLITCPVTIVRATRGLLTPEGAAQCAERISGPVECVEVDVGHHLILEEPELVIDMIQARS